MKTILLSIFGFLSALFFANRTGASNQKQKLENDINKNTLNILNDKQEISDSVNNLNDAGLNKLLIKKWHK